MPARYTNRQQPGSGEIPNLESQSKLATVRRSLVNLRIGPYLVLGTWILVLLIDQNSAAQNYSIDWYKVAGGGGASANAQYTVNGTIGQHDAGGPMTGGNYSLTGGFWALIATVPSPGAPSLTIQWINPTTVKVSWPSPSTGFVLQQNNDLNTANWSNNSGTLNDNGTTKSVTISPPSGILFFRLKK